MVLVLVVYAHQNRLLSCKHFTFIAPECPPRLYWWWGAGMRPCFPHLPRRHCSVGPEALGSTFEGLVISFAKSLLENVDLLKIKLNS